MSILTGKKYSLISLLVNSIIILTTELCYSVIDLLIFCNMQNNIIFVIAA